MWVAVSLREQQNCHVRPPCFRGHLHRSIASARALTSLTQGMACAALPRSDGLCDDEHSPH
ncbi:MAG: hypothetical protein RL701_7198 [Pseudomonadota bacterium]